MGQVVQLRRRSAGFGAVANLDPKTVTPQQIAVYQERATVAQAREKECASRRQSLAIGAAVGLSLGLTAILSSKTSSVRLIGAGLAGAGAVSGVGAVLAHGQVKKFQTEKNETVQALTSVSAPAPGVEVTLTKS